MVILCFHLRLSHTACIIFRNVDLISFSWCHILRFSMLLRTPSNVYFNFPPLNSTCSTQEDNMSCSTSFEFHTIKDVFSFQILVSLVRFGWNTRRTNCEVTLLTMFFTLLQGMCNTQESLLLYTCTYQYVCGSSAKEIRCIFFKCWSHNKRKTNLKYNHCINWHH